MHDCICLSFSEIWKILLLLLLYCCKLVSAVIVVVAAAIAVAFVVLASIVDVFVDDVVFLAFFLFASFSRQVPERFC